MVLGKHLMKTWSSMQATRAPSSGEAEFYAIIEWTSRALGDQALMDDLEAKGEVKIRSDSTACRSISLRNGTGKPSHLQVKYLWLQDAVLEACGRGEGEGYRKSKRLRNEVPHGTRD